MAERRNATRQKSFLRGCIYFNNRRSAVDCLIRDISSTGAKLIFSDAITVPDVVELYIPQKEQTLRAEVHFRSAGFEDAKRLAKAEHKKIMVDFYTSWCGWCKKLDAFLERDDIKPVFETYFIPVKLVVQESANNKALENPGADELLKKLGTQY